MDSGIIRSADGITWLRGANTVGGGTVPGQDVGQDLGQALGIPKAELSPGVRAATAALLEEVNRLRSELDRSRAQVARLEKLADEDALVPVANRRAFVRELSRMVSFARRYGTRVTILYFDINDMKHVNDTFGHAAGDAAITHVASILLGSVRGSDIVGRLGGDEFAVILANAAEETARAKAEHLARAIAATPVGVGDRSIAIEAAFGVYALAAGDDAQAMIEKADRAMYARKVRHQTPLS